MHRAAHVGRLWKNNTLSHCLVVFDRCIITDDSSVWWLDVSGFRKFGRYAEKERAFVSCSHKLYASLFHPAAKYFDLLVSCPQETSHTRHHSHQDHFPWDHSPSRLMISKIWSGILTGFNNRKQEWWTGPLGESCFSKPSTLPSFWNWEPMVWN
jgi:hypothetical protein